MDFRTIIAIIEKTLLERMSLRLREQSEENYFFIITLLVVLFHSLQGAKKQIEHKVKG